MKIDLVGDQTWPVQKPEYRSGKQETDDH